MNRKPRTVSFEAMKGDRTINEIAKKSGEAAKCLKNFTSASISLGTTLNYTQSPHASFDNISVRMLYPTTLKNRNFAKSENRHFNLFVHIFGL